MSFGLNVKEELCSIPLESTCCIHSELLGILLYCSIFTKKQLRITTSSSAFSQRLPLLFHTAFSFSFDTQEKQGKKFCFTIDSEEKMKKIFDVLEYSPSPLAVHIPFELLENSCCHLAFARGAFLAGGSITNPVKFYHLELATSHSAINGELAALLHECNFTPKFSTRKGHYICYFKQWKHIESFLIALGAKQSGACVRNSKLQKNITSSVNRQVNCDAANLTKAVDAAQSQLKAIRFLESQGLLADLPEKLQQTAQLRMENPHLTLAELAESFQPPISKSALNHRLRKLVAMTQNQSEE